MNPVVEFARYFIGYGLTFLFIVALVLLACFIGIKWRKSKDSKAAVQAETSEAKQ